ncbi:hypothetical protein B0H66DRAFT_604478 [Apodospora peruviana]|uniref:Arrestin C-terminal-like domain-containing protein n=1 Tax=Apodospora peruviana TaxID=516989 RepID=A0AAE0I143_9PEZI|nr:hypothetical protein B0H66DRAFT_604478 [Apodospora peruviana]
MVFRRLAPSKSSPALFEIRLDNDFIVFRGNEHESSGQLLKGVVVLCLISPLKVEEISLRLTGSLKLNWNDTRVTSTGMTNHRVDRTTVIYQHKWPHLGDLPTRATDAAHPRAVTLEPGNYEYPFELMLPGDLTESVEGLREGTISYKLKATISRGFISSDIHAYKRLRIIRTLDPSALEFLHAMSVENIWPNKVEYSIMVPQKAVVFGSSIPLETRFTPLLKGLELGDVTVKLMEAHDIVLQSSTGHTLREYRKEQEVAGWTIPMSRDEHWQDMIEDTGQEGWVMKAQLDLPRKLGRCIQDVNTQGIKVRHKLKLVVALKNPDGHISELRATLPVSIFISPNMPLDEDGNLVRQQPQGGAASTPPAAMNSIAPPGYGEHVLDQLYDEVDPTGLQTPPPRSGVSTPNNGHSRAGSAENLTAMLHGSMAITPAALSSRLQSVSLEQSNRSQSWSSLSAAAASSVNGPASGTATPRHQIEITHFSPPPTAPLSRQNSDENSPGTSTPEHDDYLEMAQLNKVPSYQTAVKTPARQLSYSEGFSLPNYETATSAPGSRSNSAPASRSNSAPASPQHEIREPSMSTATGVVGGMLEAIEEAPQESASPTTASPPSPPTRSPRPAMGRRRLSSHGIASFLHSYHHGSHTVDDERRRLHLIQARERVA